jgi:hypothetical protein
MKKIYIYTSLSKSKQRTFLWITLASLISLTLLSSCSSTNTSSAPAAPPPDVHVSLNENFPVAIIKDAEATFITFYTEDDYRKAFLDEMKRSLTVSQVIPDNVSPQFSITLTSLELNEATVTDTVKDQKSKDNGKVFPLAVAKLKASGTLTNLQTQQTIPWTVTHDKRERITSFQNLAQIVKGENKNLDEYRKKDFDRNEFVSLAAACGQMAARDISKTIRRQLK